MPKPKYSLYKEIATRQMEEKVRAIRQCQDKWMKQKGKDIPKTSTDQQAGIFKKSSNSAAEDVNAEQPKRSTSERSCAREDGRHVIPRRARSSRHVESTSGATRSESSLTDSVPHERACADQSISSKVMFSYAEPRQRHLTTGYMPESYVQESDLDGYAPYSRTGRRGQDQQETGLTQMYAVRNAELPVDVNNGASQTNYYAPAYVCNEDDSCGYDLTRKTAHKARRTSGSATQQGEEPLNAIADQIIRSVTRELSASETRLANNGVKNDAYEMAPPYVDENALVPAGGAAAGAAVTNTTSLQNHFCDICSNVMLPPDRVPMLVIPCGHTMCKLCVRRRSDCPVCNCEVTALTYNIMLQQIILDYQCNGTNSDVTDHSTKYMDAWNTTETERPNSASYLDKYRTLQSRCEELEAEAASICANANEQQQALAGHLAGLSESTALESQLRHEHDKLSDQLRDVTSDRLDVERKCRDLRAEIDEHHTRMPVISTALRGVRRQVEKMRLIAEENQSP